MSKTCALVLLLALASRAQASRQNSNARARFLVYLAIRGSRVLATGLRGFSPLVFSGEFHTPRLQETLQVVHRNAHPRPLGIHFHILWYRPNFSIRGSAKVGG